MKAKKESDNNKDRFMLHTGTRTLSHTQFPSIILSLSLPLSLSLYIYIDIDIDIDIDIYRERGEGERERCTITSFLK